MLNKPRYIQKFYCQIMQLLIQKMCRRHSSLNIIGLFVIYLFLLAPISQSTGVGFNANQKYAVAGRCIVDVKKQIQKLNTSNWSCLSATVIIPFPQSFSTSNISQIMAIATIGEFETQYLNKSLSVFVDLSLITQTQLVIQIYCDEAYQIQKLTIGYIIFLVESGYENYIEASQISYLFPIGIGTILNNDPLNRLVISQYLDPTIFRVIGNIKLITMICGIQAYYYSSSTKVLNIDVSGSIYPERIQFIIQSHLLEYTVIEKISICYILYNEDIINQLSNYYRFYDGIIEASSGSSIIVNSINELATINTLVGLTSFTIKNTDTMSFYVQVRNKGIVLTSDASFSSQNTLTFAYFVIESNYCAEATPFLDTNSDQCYNKCPGQMTSDNVTLSCLCYVNGNLMNSSSCNEQSNSPSSVPVGLIVGVSIGSIISIILLVILIKYLTRRSQQPENKIIKQIYFDPPEKIASSNEIINSMTVINDSPLKEHSQNLKIEESNQNSNFTALGNKKGLIQIQKKQEDQKKSFQSRHKWESAQKKYSKESICCICTKKRAFVESLCSHRFHLTCLCIWSQTNKTCPSCRIQLDTVCKYYCKSCGNNYRIVSIVSEDLNSSKLQAICSQCSINPF